MTPLRGSSTHEPLPSASHPPSPAEEDLAKASVWDDEDTSTLVSPKRKGKGKQREEDDDDDDRTVNGDNLQREAGEYPPMAEEDLESRKVEQNLKRWETMEKQRRKRARESRSSSKSDSVSSSSSFSVSDVSRRASQLWSGRGRERQKIRSDRAHPHQMLEDVDESLPMDETGPPSASSPVTTPRTSIADTSRPSSTHTSPSTDNPFETSEQSSMMTAASSSSLPTTPKNGAPGGALDRPMLQVQGPPPPQSLNLPAPPSPPPAPRAVLPRTQQVEIEEAFGEEKVKRWWTEWLCGCREDEADQAGRTNPME